MNLILRVSLFVALIIYFIFIYYFLKNKTLILKYTLLWILFGIGMLGCVIWPNILDVGSHIFGIASSMSCLFAVIIFLLILILMSLTAIVSKLNEKNKKLIQSIGILEKRLRKLEKL